MSEQVVDVFKDLQEETLEAFDSLPENEKKEIMEKVMEAQASTAEAMLSSDQSFTILNQLYSDLANMIFQTGPFVQSVANNLDIISGETEDPEGFKKSFKTLCVDLASVSRDLNTLYNSHKDKTGAPEAEELGDVILTADAYSLLATRLQDGVLPLMNALIEQIDKVEIKDDSEEEVADV